MADDLNENLENANKAVNKLKDELREAADLQRQMEQNASSYLSVIKKIGDLKRSIAKTEKEIAKADLKLQKQRDKGNDKGAEATEKLIQALRETNKEYKEQAENLSKAASGANKLKAIARSTAGFVYKWGFQNLRGWGVFEMDKAIRNATRSMSLGQKGFNQLSNNLGSAANSTTMMGVNLNELAKMQQGYSEAIGRSVMLTEAGNQAMAELAEGTGLGEGFAVEMAGAMDNFGASVETSRDLVEETMNIAAEMGVNGAAATKALQSALQKSQRFVFKGGVKALSSMANAATRLKLDMDGIAGVAENVFRPEGAIELAAKLNTIGGEFAKLGDPMKLMFKARNDFEGFAKDIGRASKEFVQFNEESGTFELKGGLAADRMREIANMTGLSVEKLQEMAVQQAKIEKIGTLLPLGIEKEDRELIESYASFKDGEAVITVGTEQKLVRKLSPRDLELIRNEKLTLKERAKLNQTFADTLENFTTLLKQLFVPFAEGLQQALGGPLMKFTEGAEKQKWFDKIRGFTIGIVGFAKSVGTFLKGMVDTFGPGGVLATVFLGSTALWFSKGISLGMGFNSVASAGGVGAISKGGLLKGGALALGGLGANYIRSTLDDQDSTVGKGLGLLGSTASFAGTGAMIGSVIPGLGTAAGGVIGGLIGAGKGIYDEYVNVNDGIVKFNPKDKFIGIGNDTIVAGTDAGGNRALANQIAGNTMGGKTEVIHKHEPMKITFEFIGLSESTAKDLLSNTRFIKDMNSRLNEVSSSVFSGGKLSPNPKFSN